MPETALTVQTAKGPYPGTVAANDLDITWTAGDAVNGNSFISTGRELLLVRNDDAGAQTLTLKSVADTFARTADISAYSVGIGEYAAFWVGDRQGWTTGGGLVLINPVASANLFFAVLRLA
jgi:hypothetical protein